MHPQLITVLIQRIGRRQRIEVYNHADRLQIINGDMPERQLRQPDPGGLIQRREARRYYWLKAIKHP